MQMNIPDPIDLFEQHDREQQQQLESCPRCDYCDYYIQDYYYDLNGDIICQDCMNDYFRKDV